MALEDHQEKPWDIQLVASTKDCHNLKSSQLTPTNSVLFWVSISVG